MNILVTGANGQLGNEMRIISRHTGDNYTFTDVVGAEGVETTILDITDADAVRRIVAEKGIRCIVNCAAYTNVDKAESDEALCRRLWKHSLRESTTTTPFAGPSPLEETPTRLPALPVRSLRLPTEYLPKTSKLRGIFSMLPSLTP